MVLAVFVDFFRIPLQFFRMVTRAPSISLERHRSPAFLRASFVHLCATALNSNLPVSNPISEQWEVEEVKKIWSVVTRITKTSIFFYFCFVK